MDLSANRAYTQSININTVSHVAACYTWFANFHFTTLATGKQQLRRVTTNDRASVRVADAD